MGISRISAKHLDRPRRGEQVRITSVLLALLFILPLLAQAPGSSFEPVSMSTSGKSTDADVAVTGINVTTPSAWISAIPTLAPMNHTIRVSIVNIGGSAADGELLLKVSGSPVDNRTVNINPGAQENHLLYWDASSFEGGSSYTLEAVWEADGIDADSSNDEMTITGLSVASVEDAISIADTLPADGDTMPRAEWSGAMTIANIGNQPVNATAQLSLTSSSGSISITSSVATLQPGSLANPPVPQIITLNFDGSSLEGAYTLSGNLLVTGASGPSTTPIEPRTVTFTALISTLIPASNMNLDPGAETTLNFILQNSGDATEDFTVTQSNSSSPGEYWAIAPTNIHDLTNPLSVDPGMSAAIQVPLQVPADAEVGDTVVVTILVHSIAAGYDLTANTVVMAGGIHQSTITQNHSHAGGPDIANITPGVPKTIDYTLTNTGTAPTQYQIFVSPLSSVPYWTIESPVTITDLLMANETRTIPVTITTPEVEMPLNPAWKITSGQQVQLGIQAIPMEGGLPSTNQTTLIMDGILNVEVDITGELNNITADEAMSDNSNRYIDFEVTLVHNLGSSDQGTVVTLATTADGSDTGISFVPEDSGHSTFEYTRWAASITPTSMNLAPGDTGTGIISISHQPNAAFPYPAAGLFSFGFTAKSDWSGSMTNNDSAVVSFGVDKIFGAEVTSGEIAIGDPADVISGTVTLQNTGNDNADFEIEFVPVDGWEISTNPTQLTGVKSRTNLYPTTEGEEGSLPLDRRIITVSAQPPSSASADMIHEIWIYVSSTTTTTGDTQDTCEARDGTWNVIVTSSGVDNSECKEILSFAPAYFQLNELVTAELNPANSTAIIDRLGQTTIMLQLNNTGNSNTTFDLNLSNLNRDRLYVSFSDDVTNEQLYKQQTVGPGSQAIVRVYTQAGTTARADEVNKFEVTASAVGMAESITSGIVVQVNPFHFITMQMNTVYNAAPGGSISIPINLINNGNLLELINVEATIPDGWNQSSNVSNVSIEPGIHGEGITLTIALPPLDPGSILAADEIYNIPIRVLNITEGIVIAVSNITVTILPVFALNVLESPSRIAVLPGSDRSVLYEVENVGNAPMSINIGWTLEDAGGMGEDARFGVQIEAESNPLTVAISDTTTIIITISPLAPDHFRLETATLSIIFSPTIETGLDDITINTPIVVERVQADDEISLSSDGPFDCGPSFGTCYQIEIPWVHAPSIGSSDSSAADYNLSLVDTERLVNFVEHPEKQWSFEIDNQCILVSTSTFPGIGSPPDDLTCITGWDAGTANNLYDGGTIAMKVVIPDRLTMGLAPGDGWNITLRLKNTNEPNTPPYWTDFVVKLRMPDTSDPLIESVSFRGPSSESSQTSIQVVVVNAGNADMPIGTQLSLSCSGAYARITDNTGFVTVPALTHNDTFYANWSVTTDPIPWYTDSETFLCSATLILPSFVFGNNETNDALDVTLQIESWTPPSTTLSISGITLPFSPVFVLGLLVLIGSLSLLQRGNEEQSNRLHLSAYVAAAALGIMSLSNPASWFPALAALISIFFAGVVAWISSSELQTIHDDRKKSRIGTRAVLEDHDKEQANTRKELRAIISCAPYAFLPFVLITPSLAIDLGTGSLGALLLYLIVSPILVHLILWFLDRSYDRLYGELADIELRAIKIKKILGTVGKSSDPDQSEAQSSSGGE